MYYLIRYLFVSILFALSIAACSVSGETQPVALASVRATVVATSVNLTATHTSLPGTPEEPLPTGTPTMTTTPSPTSTPTPTTMPGVDAACQAPTLLSDETLSLLSSGSILVKASRENGIWAFSNGLAEPHFIAAPVADMVRSANLSPSRTQIAFQGADEDIVLYDLLTEEKTLIPWQESWHARAVSGWREDGRLELFVRSEHTLGVGVTRETILLDPITLQVEPITQEFHLPDYYFDDKNPFHGFASWNPSETQVLYTAPYPEGSGAKYVLWDIITNQELWHSGEVDGYFIPIADWSEDGDKILMAVTPPRLISVPNPGPINLVSLEVDSLQYTVLAQLTTLPEMADIRYVEWSPDRRYVFFALLQGVLRGPGYIFDTEDGSIRPICEPDFINGWWLPKANQLLYVVETNDARRELKLLDVASWQVQSLWQTDADGYPDIVGWTPVEFPTQ